MTEIEKAWQYLKLMGYDVASIDIITHVSDDRTELVYSIKTFLRGQTDPLHIFAKGHRLLESVMSEYLAYVADLAVKHVTHKKEDVDLLYAQLTELMNTPLAPLP